jgi:hypothetical protein
MSQTAENDFKEVLLDGFIKMEIEIKQEVIYDLNE